MTTTTTRNEINDRNARLRMNPGQGNAVVTAKRNVEAAARAIGEIGNDEIVTYEIRVLRGKSVSVQFVVDGDINNELGSILVHRDGGVLAAGGRESIKRAIKAGEARAMKAMATVEKLGYTQVGVLHAMNRNSRWFPACGWTWENRSKTTRALDSLVRHGIVDHAEQVMDNGSKRQVYTITEFGREVAEADRLARIERAQATRRHRGEGI